MASEKLMNLLMIMTDQKFNKVTCKMDLVIGIVI